MRKPPGQRTISSKNVIFKKPFSCFIDWYLGYLRLPESPAQAGCPSLANYPIEQAVLGAVPEEDGTGEERQPRF